jgi:uncharacterized protein (TIGR03083 family)
MDLIAGERRALADMLEKLSPAQWEAPSLCAGWSVRHVVAHVTMPFRYPVPRFLAELARSGGRFGRTSDRVAARDARLPAADLVAAVRDHAELEWKPPGGGLAGALTHDVVHTLDITRALGIDHPIPPPALTRVLEAVTAPRAARHFGADLSGVRLRAPELDWSAGTGELAEAAAEDIILLASGRALPAGALTGPGAALLAARGLPARAAPDAAPRSTAPGSTAPDAAPASASAQGATSVPVPVPDAAPAPAPASVPGAERP